MKLNPGKTVPLLILILMISVAAYAQSKPDRPLDLYILIGQSNMAGRAPITAENKDEHDDRVFMFTKDQQWVVARHPLHFDKPKSVGAGPGLSFGIAMAQANPKARIGLIPCAVGGSPIEHWLPGVYDKATDTHPYDDAVIRIKAAMAYGTIKGILWHQGESNSKADQAKIYLAQLTELISRVRALVGNPKVPFIAGELGRYRPVYANINVELVKLPASVPLTAVVSSEGLVHKGDTTHFDGPSVRELGKRYAEQMLKVQRLLK